MALLLLAFFAGVLTITAPCVLLFLPVILGGSISGQGRRRPYIVIASLGVSVIVFTLLLKATTLLLGVPQQFWQLLAGFVLILIGLHYLGLPLWEKLTGRLGLPLSSNRQLAKATREQGGWGAIATGAALGPVFASCSPTFAFIVAAVLPADPLLGLIYLVVYVAGMTLTLLLIALLGRRVIARLGVVNNPRSWLARAIGIIFIVVGLLIATGLDKRLQAAVLEAGWYDPITSVENSLQPR